MRHKIKIKDGGQKVIFPTEQGTLEVITYWENQIGSAAWTLEFQSPPSPRPANYGRAEENSRFLQAGFVQEYERQQKVK